MCSLARRPSQRCGAERSTRVATVPLAASVHRRGRLSAASVAACPSRELIAYASGPQHRLNFLPEPHGHGSFRPTLLGLTSGSCSGRSGSVLASRNGPRLARGRALGGLAVGGGEVGPGVTGSTCEGGGSATERMADASLMRWGSARSRTRSVSGSGAGASVGPAVVPHVPGSTACSCDAESSAAAGCLSLGTGSIGSSTLRPCMRATRKATASCG